jgi:glucose-1-phosphate thymidylyltransferase
MKAIIPVAGAGTKLRPHSYTQPKALIPLAGKTVLSIIIDQLKDAGINEFIFIVGYLGDKIRDHVKNKFPDLKAHYVHQVDRQGVGHAVELAKEVVESETSMIGVRKVDDPRDFGVAEINENGFIDHVVEKPNIPKSNMALVGVYKIRETEQMFQCLENNIRQGLRSHGEYSLTDALDCMISLGARFKSFKVENWFDCGKKETMLESNAILLKKFGPQVKHEYSFENTVIVQPVSIGAGCTIKNSIIGPNVAIGENTIIDSSIIKNSIIGSFSNMFDIVLDASIIGSDTDLKGETRTLNIGDNTSIDLG